MNKEYVVVLRVRVDDDTLVALGRHRGEKKATLRDFRNWCGGVLDARIEDIGSEGPREDDE